MRDPERFERAIAAIDAANSSDPLRVSVASRSGPKEVVHAQLVTDWVRRLTDEPSEALLLAARAHHIRRWTVPRATQPAGRAGYLRWRTGLYEFHAQTCAELLEREGYVEDEIAPVRRLIRKQELKSNPDAQTLEDALCLVFFETQAAGFAEKEPVKVRGVMAKTLRKMSANAREKARALPVAPPVRTLLDECLSKL